MRAHRGAPLDNKDNNDDVTRGVDRDRATLRTARPREQRPPRSVAAARPIEPSIPVSLGALGLRLAQGALMVHNGLDKLADPEGFAEFVVSQHLDFLPDALTPEQWTIGAAGVEIVAPVLLAIGVLPRLSALSLLGTMSMAVVFHVHATGLEGFPLGVVEAHQYAFETAFAVRGHVSLSLPRGTGEIFRDEVVVWGPKTRCTRMLFYKHKAWIG